jgi:GT2 family glycosyltransferase
MNLSIIIPTYNTRDLTLACLSAIQRHPPPDTYEVIVVDNNSADGTYEEVQKHFPTVVALRNTRNIGFGRACNQGARAATGDFILFLNSDTEVTGDTLANLLAWMKSHPKTGIAGPEFLGPNQTLLQMSWNWNPLLGGEILNRFYAPQKIAVSKLRQRWIHSLQSEPRSVPFICGACLMIRRDVFDRLGGFDECFELYFEDADLCLRCAEAGWLVDFVPESKIVHHIGQSSKGRWTMAGVIYQQSHLSYYRKHAPAGSALLLKTYLFFKWLGLLVDSLLERQEKEKAKRFSRAYFHVIFESTRFDIDSDMDSRIPARNGHPAHRGEGARIPIPAEAMAISGKRRINLGCGTDILPGWINLDAAALPGVDIVHDIEKSPWPFEAESVDYISAHEILEHVEYIRALREAHRVLRKGGIFEIVVPHFTSRNNWIDPTHKKAFSIRTFEFFITNSRFRRDYYFDFAFRGIRRRRIVFEKRWLIFNYLIEPLVNLHPKIAVFYEATFLHSLFPAESVIVELEK